MMTKLLSPSAFATMLLFAAVNFMSCSGSKDYSQLNSQTENVSAYFTELKSSAPELVKGSEVKYVHDKSIDVTLEINGNFVKPSAVEPVLFNYFTAVMMSDNKGRELDEMIKLLTETETPMEIKLSDNDGQEATFILNGKDFKRLQSTPLSQLNPSAARNNVCKIFDGIHSLMADSLVRNKKAEIEATGFEAGFFTITVIYDSSKDFARLTLPNLKNRAIKFFGNLFIDWGSLKQPLFTMMQSLPADGIIVTFKGKDSDKRLRTTLTWADLY